MTRIVGTDAASLDEAADLLRAGLLVAFPTETVYGLGGIATDPAAIGRIYAAKGRPAHNPLILHLADAAAAGEFAHLDDRARALAAAFWPGPLTLVLPLRADAGIVPAATAHQDSVALRIPAHPVAQALLRRVAAPVAAPSANPSGRISPTEAGHVAADLAGRVALVIDGGACPVGVESTVVDIRGSEPARLLRPGGLARAALEAVTGPLAAAPELAAAGELRSPGLLASHYAPQKPVRLDAVAVAGDEALLAFGPRPLPGALVVENLSPAGDLAEAAARLFTLLRRLDRSEARGIAVMKVPEGGLGEAINDRLRRAAAPRGP